MGTPYSSIYNRALAKITDYDLAIMPETDFQLMLKGWLSSAISKFRKCESDLSKRDDELEAFNVDLVDEEIEILAILMTIEWLQPQITSCLVTNQMFSGKEEKLWQYLPTVRYVRKRHSVSLRIAGKSLELFLLQHGVQIRV